MDKKYYVVADNEIIYVSANEEEAYSYAMERYSNGDFEVYDTEPAGVPYAKPKKELVAPSVQSRKDWSYKAPKDKKSGYSIAGWIIAFVGLAMQGLSTVADANGEIDTSKGLYGVAWFFYGLAILFFILAFADKANIKSEKTRSEVERLRRELYDIKSKQKDQ